MDVDHHDEMNTMVCEKKKQQEAILTEVIVVLIDCI